MPWVRFDDRFPTHRKIRRLSDAAFRLHVSAIHWCSEHLTDGHIPDGELDLVSDVKAPARVVSELERAGLWEPVQEGWLIHDFLDYQPSASKVRADREAKKERQEKWRKGKGSHGKGGEVSGDASHDGASDASEVDTPYPPRPVPAPSRPFGGTLGGGVALASDSVAPPPRCPQHENTPTTAPCGGCKEARLAREQWDRDVKEAAKTAGLAARGCRMCDIEGWAYVPGTKIPKTPWVKCDHSPVRSVG